MKSTVTDSEASLDSVDSTNEVISLQTAAVIDTDTKNSTKRKRRRSRRGSRGKKNTKNSKSGKPASPRSVPKELPLPTVSEEQLAELDMAITEDLKDIFCDFYLENIEMPQLEENSSATLISGYLSELANGSSLNSMAMNFIFDMKQIIISYYNNIPNHISSAVATSKGNDLKFDIDLDCDLDRELGLVPLTKTKSAEQGRGEISDSSLDFHPIYTNFPTSPLPSYSPKQISANYCSINSTYTNSPSSCSTAFTPCSYSPTSPDLNHNRFKFPCPMTPPSRPYLNGYGIPPIYEYPAPQQQQQYMNMNMNMNMYGMPSPFDKMSNQEILRENFGIPELIKYDLIIRLMTDNVGSRYIQRELKKCHSHEKRKKLASMIIHYLDELRIGHEEITKLANDQFGNYMIQLLFEFSGELERGLLIQKYLSPNIISLCRSKFGCRVIQECLAVIKNINNVKFICDALRAQCTVDRMVMAECLKCCNSNRVLQCLLDLNIPYQWVAFIGYELERDLLFYSEHKNACRVVQSFLNAYGPKLNVMKLIDGPNKKYLNLASTVHGNYTVQCIIDKRKFYAKHALFIEFRNKLIYDIFEEKNVEKFSKNKHGSNVIETCIKSADKKQIDYLVTVLCRRQGHLLTVLMRHEFGNYIPRTLLKHCHDKQQEMKIVSTIHSYIIDLYNHHHNDYQTQSRFAHCYELIENAKRIKKQNDAHAPYTDNNYNNNHNVNHGQKKSNYQRQHQQQQQNQQQRQYQTWSKYNHHSNYYRVKY